jgi:hypothetical protein
MNKWNSILAAASLSALMMAAQIVAPKLEVAGLVLALGILSALSGAVATMWLFRVRQGNMLDICAAAVNEFGAFEDAPKRQGAGTRIRRDDARPVGAEGGGSHGFLILSDFCGAEPGSTDSHSETRLDCPRSA